MINDEDYYDVKMPPEVAAQWQALMPPDFPPLEEMVLRMRKDDKCGVCGGETENGKIHAMEPSHLDQDGVLYGKTICNNCLEKGK